MLNLTGRWSSFRSKYRSDDRPVGFFGLEAHTRQDAENFSAEALGASAEVFFAYRCLAGCLLKRDETCSIAAAQRISGGRP